MFTAKFYLETEHTVEGSFATFTECFQTAVSDCTDIFNPEEDATIKIMRDLPREVIWLDWSVSRQDWTIRI